MSQAQQSTDQAPFFSRSKLADRLRASADGHRQSLAKTVPYGVKWTQSAAFGNPTRFKIQGCSFVPSRSHLPQGQVVVRLTAYRSKIRKAPLYYIFAEPAAVFFNGIGIVSDSIHDIYQCQAG
jgi:hypothetical protein